MKYFGKRCRFGKEVVGVSAVPTGLGSLSSNLPRTYVLGYRMPPLRGCSLPAHSVPSPKICFSRNSLAPKTGTTEAVLHCLSVLIRANPWLILNPELHP